MKDPERVAREQEKFQAGAQRLVDAELAAGREPAAALVAIASGSQPVQAKPSSTFFWLPVKFWPIALAALALLPLSSLLRG